VEATALAFSLHHLQRELWIAYHSSSTFRVLSYDCMEQLTKAFKKSSKEDISHYW